MCYFVPGKDPTQPWQRVPISEPSQKGKEIPGTRNFSHGLGHGDVNGDGRVDIIVADGWWEQPEKIDHTTPWKFHRVDLNPVCADMFTYDIDGDGKNDIVSSSAHLYGFWWHQQKLGKDGPTFIRHDLFPPPPEVAKLPREHKLSLVKKSSFLQAVNKSRTTLGHASWKMDANLSALAHVSATGKKGEGKIAYKGTIKLLKTAAAASFNPEQLVKELLPDLQKSRDLASPALEVGVGAHRQEDGAWVGTLVIGDSGAFSLPAQTHALHCVDINGDGLKDLVTGCMLVEARRTVKCGDAGPNDPAYLYWFEAKRDKKRLHHLHAA